MSTFCSVSWWANVQKLFKETVFETLNNSDGVVMWFCWNFITQLIQWPSKARLLVNESPSPLMTYVNVANALNGLPNWWSRNDIYTCVGIYERSWQVSNFPDHPKWTSFPSNEWYILLSLRLLAIADKSVARTKNTHFYLPKLSLIEEQVIHKLLGNDNESRPQTPQKALHRWVSSRSLSCDLSIERICCIPLIIR